MDEVYEAFISIADKKKVVVDEDLIGIAPNGVSHMSTTFVKETVQEYLNRQ